ncbi:MAG: alpha/beta fold hydrolase [Hyphomonas sp.]|nr:alpha/beta fold hydrolase [Hyphomonas sp.]
MSDDTSNATAGATRHFVQIGDQTVHYRVQGQGPVVVMLHDSPRSSRLHVPTMQRLSDQFTLVALDTPGYGSSSPLDKATPTIEDFADSLNAALCALGIERAPLYAPHTGAKIALEYAAKYGHPVRLILDGLSIPPKPTAPEFIDAYMRPFIKDSAGAFIATEWTHVRDMTRWFPWFNRSTATRIALEPTAEWLHDYTLDLFSAGPHYSGAYAAAMRYPPLPALRKVSVPTLVGAREDDVLYSSLPRVPVNENPNLAIEPLPADTETWFGWLRTRFAEACDIAAVSFSPPTSDLGPKTYVEGPAGQVLVHRTGQAGGTPLLILDAPTTLHALHLASLVPETIRTLVPELPGFGESGPLDAPDAEGFVATLSSIIDSLADGKVDVFATGLSVPLALALAIAHPGKVGRLILDGGLSEQAQPAASEVDRLLPEIAFSSAGAHLMQAWHMLRDAEASWPWFDNAIPAQRQIEPLLDVDHLYEPFLGILKQPRNYGDAARAALAASVPLSSVSQPCFVFSHDSDRAYLGTEEAAASLPNATIAPRPPRIEDAVPALLGFLGA